MGFLAGKRALIVGVAGDRSIAWGIAKAMHREGAELAYTYQNDKLKERVEKYAAQTKSDIVLPCDVASDEQIEAVFAHLVGNAGGDIGDEEPAVRASRRHVDSVARRAQDDDRRVGQRTSSRIAHQAREVTGAPLRGSLGGRRQQAQGDDRGPRVPAIPSWRAAREDGAHRSPSASP